MSRYIPVLLGIVALASCSSGGTDNNHPGTIAVGVDPISGTATQGGQAVTTATLTRGGGFTGTVNFTVAGAPTGVTAAVGNPSTTGTTTTATVTITVAANVTPGSYPLILHATGSGVTEATANYLLNVVATPAVALSLSAPALTIVQGAAIPTTTVTIARTNFTGNVTLSVDNLPAGVTAAFAPANPQSGTSSVLTLTVASTAATGTFTNLAVHAAGSGITDATTPLSLTISAPAPDFQLSLTQPALSIVQGASTPTTTLNIARTNFTGPVTLTTTVTPATEGLTITFNPASPTTAGSTVVTVAVDASTTPGIYTIAINGNGTPGDRTTPLVLTVLAGVPVGNFSLSTTPPTSINVTQGASPLGVTVNINHTGGNLSSVTLSTTSATALPAGLVLAFSATQTGQPTSTLSISATGAVPVGPYPIVIHGNVLNLAEQTVNFTINVVAPSGSGNASLSFAGCDPIEKPVWFASTDGTGGTWTPVTGVADVYTFNITQTKGGFAYVTNDDGDISLAVRFFTQAELTSSQLKFCTPFVAGKTVNGQLVNRGGSTFSSIINFAGRTNGPTLNGAFQMFNVPNGVFDLIAYERQPTLIGSGDKLFIKRGENPAGPVGSFTVPVDFLDPVRSSPPDAGSVSLLGLNGDAETSSMHFLTGPACTSSILYTGLQGLGTTSVYGVPASLRVAGDMHQFTVSITGLNGASRFLTENFLDLHSRIVTGFQMPTSLPTPAFSDAGGGHYKRPMLVMNGVSAEYNQSHTLLYSSLGFDLSGFVGASQAWVGGSDVTLTLPDFHGIGGFQDSWVPGTSDPISVQVSSAGLSGAQCAAGTRFVTASKSGTI